MGDSTVTSVSDPVILLLTDGLVSEVVAIPFLMSSLFNLLFSSLSAELLTSEA